ncbi:MAG TPA: TIGR02221 family CRISPR-associated protein [Blastocatellia bacterium]|nr:TIGR02221 family CRISPR-associated protein [Blastocatellia bacterium]
MKALTFVGLGTGDGYKTARYLYGGKVVESDLFPIALYEFFQPDHMTVFVTKESKERYWNKLCEGLAGRIEPKPVEIPWGGKPDELWTIFDRVVQSVDEGEEVIFDITHGFRSLPFVVFLAVAYLRAVKNVRVRGIVYGAFEARDNEGRAPVFDLSPFLSLLDWLAAVHIFRRSGSAADLSRLLQEIQAEAWRERPTETSPIAAEKPTALQKMGDRVNELSQALLLIRPLEVMEKAQRLADLFTDAALNEATRWAKPFALIAPALGQEFAQFATSPSVKNLHVQHRMIAWYIERGLFVQALTLARELLVTKVCVLLDLENPLQREARERAERLLNYLTWSKQPDERKRSDPWTGAEPDAADVEKFRAHDQAESLIALWSSIRDARNDVDHAGMKEQPTKASALVTRVKEIGETLKRIFGGEHEMTVEPDVVTIDLSTFYSGAAKLGDLPEYERRALELAGEGRAVVLTGQAPIWMYLKIAHALHGKARRLSYLSPVTGEVVIFDHDPW